MSVSSKEIEELFGEMAEDAAEKKSVARKPAKMSKSAARADGVSKVAAFKAAQQAQRNQAIIVEEVKDAVVPAAEIVKQEDQALPEAVLAQIEPAVLAGSLKGKKEKAQAKPVKPAVKSETVILRAYQAGLDVSGWTSQEIVEKVNQLQVAFNCSVDVLLWVKGQFAPAIYMGGQVWQLPYKGDATISQDIYRAKIVVSRAGNIEIWQKSLT